MEWIDLFHIYIDHHYSGGGGGSVRSIFLFSSSSSSFWFLIILNFDLDSLDDPETKKKITKTKQKKSKYAQSEHTHGRNIFFWFLNQLMVGKKNSKPNQNNHVTNGPYRITYVEHISWPSSSCHELLFCRKKTKKKNKNN